MNGLLKSLRPKGFFNYKKFGVMSSEFGGARNKITDQK
jgi:hypothetical protein